MCKQINKSFKIGSKNIGDGYPCFLVAEIGQAHEGSLGVAHSYIDLASDIGLDAIKFQMHLANEESTLDEEFRVKFSYQDKNRFEYWKRMEFSMEGWTQLREHASKKNILFSATPFSIKAVELLTKLKIDFWKIGSGDISFNQMIDKIIKKNEPILFSTGLGSEKEIDNLTTKLRNNNKKFAILHCTSKYPASLKQTRLNMLDFYKKNYNCPSGLSDHSGNVNSSISSIARGANILEAHLTFEKKMFGPDSKASLNPKDFQLLKKYRDDYYEIKINENQIFFDDKEKRRNKIIFGRSLSLKKNLQKGHVLKKTDILFKKPGNGIKPSELEKVINKKLCKNVSSKKLLKWNDFK